MLTDDAVRAELERIHGSLATDWNNRKWQVEGYIDALRRIAESQQVLREIIERGCYDISLNIHRPEDCPACKDHIKLARNAIGGK